MLVADLEHGESLINTDYLATLEALRHRSSYSTGPRRHIENPLIALQDEHFNQLLGKISANPRGAAIKLRRVLRIMEMRLVPVAMIMLMFVSASMLVVMSVLVIMGVSMPVFVSVIVSVFMPVLVDVIVCVGIVFMTVIMKVRMAVTMFVLASMLFVIIRMSVFMFVFFAHGCIVLSDRFS
jgi:hypothetical protein